MMSEGPIYRGS